MKKRRFSFAAILAVGLSLSAFAAKDLFDEKRPVLTIGGDASVADHVGAYKGISLFCTDDKGNIYVGDIVECRIDKYDPSGKYLASIGKKGQGPGELQGIGSFAVDDKGRLFTYRYPGRFVIFDENGVLLSEVDCPAELDRDYAELIKIDRENNVYVLFYSTIGSRVVKFSPDMKTYRIIHVDPKRKTSDFESGASFLPPLLIDFDLDERGDLYITDAFDYRVYRYSSTGSLSTTYSRRGKREDFRKRDMVLNFGDEIVNALDQSPDVLRVLKKRGQYMPRIFGIALDKGRMFVWTSEQDDEFRFIVDIYDRDFKPLGKVALYDYLPRRSVSIRNGLVYSPDMRSDDMALKRKVGRLAYFQFPYLLNVYDLNGGRPAHR